MKNSTRVVRELYRRTKKLNYGEVFMAISAAYIKNAF